MKRFLFFVILLFALNVFVSAQDIPVRKHSNFSGISATLKELVRKNGKFRQNTFYISDVKKDNLHEFAYAFWKQDKSIIILQLPLKKETADYYWLYSKARIDLLTGVVPTEKDVGASTFLVDRPWVNKILRSCKKGYKLSISKQKK